MTHFKVDLNGRGMLAYVDDELRHLDFTVTRYVAAPDAEAAGQLALEEVMADRRAHSAEGFAPPVVSVESVTAIPPGAELPDRQPGFAFYPIEADA